METDRDEELKQQASLMERLGDASPQSRGVEGHEERRAQESLNMMEQERHRREEKAWLAERIKMEEALQVVQRREEDYWSQQNGRARHEADKLARKDILERYCKRNGFAGINEPRKSGCVVWRASATYAIHTAAEQGDARIVAMLLKEGACPGVHDSSGRTAADIATKLNKRGSHDAVLRLFETEKTPEMGTKTASAHGGA